MATPEIEFELEGMGDMLARLEQWAEGASDAADEAIQTAGADAADLVQENAPVLTGRLRGSVTHDRVKWGLVVVEVGQGIPYTRPQESRTTFFNRSINQVEDELLERVASAVERTMS